jgi:hypothetical protein
MKKLLLTVVLGLCTLAGFSQAKFDVHAGMSMANITNSDADLKIGYSVGVGMDYAITDMWAFQTGLNFTSKGCKGSEKGVDAKINPVYLDIPLLAAIKLPISEGNTFVVNAGPYVGFGLGGKATVESGGAEVILYNLSLPFFLKTSFRKASHKYKGNIESPFKFSS